jgi:hypothetical protein
MLWRKRKEQGVAGRRRAARKILEKKRVTHLEAKKKTAELTAAGTERE